ncbi:ABC transporter family protein [Penicillium brasilianum]|uniref:ABC transporter family protein n=1 Tax=Penicillium brasilianum TaxID=104259 RepID=A0A1S9RH63_PENBI|nr:ABC transporter family protein [Penicillium brasilianum]
MPLNAQVASLAAGSVALFLAGLDSIPAIISIADRIARRSSPQDEASLAKTAYRDEDGEATTESLKAFSDWWQRVAIAIFSGSGFFVTLALAVLITLKYDPDYLILAWLQLGIWAFLSVQAIAFFTEPRPTSRFELGQFAFGGSLTALAITGIQIRLAWDSQNVMLREQPWIALVSVQLASALLRALFTILLPRRPDVFFDGQIVDRELTVTAFGRYTFSWAGSILGYTVKNRTLALTDLPKLRSAKRAESLRAHFERARGSRKIWKALVFAHWDTLLFQLFLTLIISVLSFGPQMALFKILSSLETRGTDSFDPLQTALWVLALGGLMLLNSSFEAWLFWAVCSKLFVPIYAELSAVVFAKSMRRKDAKSTKKSKTKDDPEESAKALLKEQNGEEEEDDEASIKKNRQSIINLAAVDARRISDFTSYSYLIPFAMLKVFIGCSFLVKILGWRSAFAGIAVSLLVTPLNIFAAKKYTSAQDKLMKLRDQKMAIVTEVLQGIRQIKFSALEEQWQKKIGQVREAELGALWISFLYDIVLLGIWILGPIGLSAVSLAVYALIHGGLTASVAFTAMAVFGALEMSLAILPEIISNGLEAKVSADRIDVYMQSAEKTVNTVASDSIAFEDVSVGWPADKADNDEEDEDRFLLRELNLAFPKKGLSVISGRTGSGKSLLLASILGECDVLQGTIKVPVPPPIKDRFDHLATSANWNIDSAIAYVAQIPWIENATMKDNILFGLPYHEERYRKTLFACALQKDLEMMPDGELTDIGANGVNLSGGQRWRVSFARALYSRAGILVMDDIFSALDAHTGRHVFEQALTGELGQGRTRVLVTHHVALCLPKTEYSVLLENGCVKYAGTIDDLRKENHLDDILQEEHEATEEDQSTLNEESTALNPEETTLQKVISNTSRRRPSHSQNDTTPKGTSPKKFIEDEQREVGSVRLSVYASYFSMGGHIVLWLITLLVYLSYSSLMIGRSWWINVWTSSSSNTQVHPEQFSALLQHTMSAQSAHSSTKDDSLQWYLGVYVGISVLACIIGTARFYFILSASVRASRNLFNSLTFAILRAPLRWLDTVPLGRILNRFTSDFHMIDSRIGYELGFFCSQVLEVCGILVAGVLVSPLVLVLAGILFVICMKLSMTYLAGAREIKRLESTAKSPVFEQFGSSLAGLITIRAFSKSETFIEIIYGKINAHAQAWWTMWLFNRWLGIRMNLVGAVFSTLTAALVVSLPGISASLAGFALSFALQCNTAIAFVLRQYANIELNMNATERVIEYSKIELENQGGVDAPAAWPTDGRLEVNDLVVGYAPDLPPVLKGLSFTVEKNQRVGVVGRTGAGKSSLTLALFRFLEAREGQILIDGLDVSKITLHDLRSRLAIIPQDPVLFSGTVRTNLDPFDEYSDTELTDALARVHLISSTVSDDEATLTSQAATPPQSTITGATTPDTATARHANTNIFTSLSAPISEGGLNLSQGQRQLLCLARAIVSRPKIMVLDEATSAVDMETDALIQQSIRAEFGRNATTLLVIAHRLSTIADFDHILVMDAGKAVEFGPPKDLMGIENGVFKNLVDNSGEKAVLEKMIFGEQ